jgi:serine protease Do
VISGLNRDIGETMYDHFFQTDAALNHGNSGGPMFNMDGEVIAIDTGLTSSPGNTGSIGIGYSLPIKVRDRPVHEDRRSASWHPRGARTTGHQ